MCVCVSVFTLDAISKFSGSVWSRPVPPHLIIRPLYSVTRFQYFILAASIPSPPHKNTTSTCLILFSIIFHPLTFLFHPLIFLFHPLIFLFHSLIFLFHSLIFLFHPLIFLFHFLIFLLYHFAFLFHPLIFLFHPLIFIFHLSVQCSILNVFVFFVTLYIQYSSKNVVSFKIFHVFG